MSMAGICEAEHPLAQDMNTDTSEQPAIPGRLCPGCGFYGESDAFDTEPVVFNGPEVTACPECDCSAKPRRVNLRNYL